MSDDLISTGLAGLTVAVTSEAAPAVPALAPYPKAPLPDGWTLNKVAALVRDVAQAMYDLPTILTKHGLTPPQYAALADNEFFKRALEQFTLDWNTAENTQKRLALEAAIGMESVLPDVIVRAQKPTEPLSDVVSLVKLLAEIAGCIGSKAAQAPTIASEKFKIVINLGADTIKYDASTTPVQILQQPEGSGDRTTLQALLEAAGSPASVQANPKGA